MADSRDYLLGKDSTGAEYWLVPRKGSAPGGHRMIEIRNSKKAVPEKLQGMWTNGDAAQRAFDDHLKTINAVKKAPAKKVAES